MNSLRRFLRDARCIGRTLFIYALLSLPAVQAALSQTCTVTDLGTLPGDPLSGATSINQRGQIVGASGVAPKNHAFFYERGAMTYLGTLPGRPYSEAYAINNSGQVAGSAYGEGIASHAFLYDRGQITDLGTLPGARYSFSYALNERGQVVGVADTSDQSLHGFLFDRGTMQDLEQSRRRGRSGYCRWWHYPRRALHPPPRPSWRGQRKMIEQHLRLNPPSCKKASGIS